MAQAKISEQAAPAAPIEGNLKRAIQMKMFATDIQKARVALAYSEKKPRAEWDIAVGQLVGLITKVKEQTFEQKSGEINTALQALGEFEAVVFESGEVIESGVAYLPGYYLESVQALLEDPTIHSVEVAVEIHLVATGKSIPVAYEVANLVKRRPESPLNRMKAEIAAAGRLRLPPPTELKRHPAEVSHIEPQTAEAAE
jgi:hypothetical protein